MPDVPAERIDALSAAIHGLLNGRKVAPVELPPDHPDDEVRQLTGFVNAFIKDYDDFAEYLKAVSKGDLNHMPPRSKLALMSAFKALTANLRQLTWVAQQIAAGDFSQRIDFMGDFSQAFNKMTGDLDKAFKQIAGQKEAMTRHNEAMAKEIEERKLVEEEMRRGEKRIQAVLDAGLNAASGMNVVGGCLIASLPDGLSDAGVDLVGQQAARLAQSASVRGVILDVSAVRVLDSRLFSSLVTMTKTIALLGARVVFTGFQPGAVSALMDLGVDFSMIEGAVSLEDAFDRLGLAPPGQEDEGEDGEDFEEDGYGRAGI